MGSVVSQVAAPPPKKNQQTQRQRDFNFTPFRTAPGTVDTGNVPRQQAHPQQPVHYPQQQPYHQTVSVVTMPGSVVGGRIVQPAPVTVYQTIPSAPMGQPVGYMQPSGSVPVQQPAYTNSKGTMCDAYGNPVNQGYHLPPTNNDTDDYRGMSAPPPYSEIDHSTSLQRDEHVTAAPNDPSPAPLPNSLSPQDPSETSQMESVAQASPSGTTEAEHIQTQNVDSAEDTVEVIERSSAAMGMAREETTASMQLPNVPNDADNDIAVGSSSTLPIVSGPSESEALAAV